MGNNNPECPVQKINAFGKPSLKYRASSGFYNIRLRLDNDR
jgi:hypothetical protein